MVAIAVHVFAAKVKLIRRVPSVLAAVRQVLFATAMTAVCAGTASAYVGDSFISIPGTTGKWQGANYKNWIRIEANYWSYRPTRFNPQSLEGDRMTFGGPAGPHPGTPSSIVFSMDKRNPDVAQLMDKCVKKTPIPELKYAESSERARAILDLGPRPAQFPAYWEYKLKDVQISGCPVVADAPEQAFVVSFKDIEWLNYDPKGSDIIKINLKPEALSKLAPAPKSPKTKAFVITWIAPATLVDEKQCAVMNAKPTEDDYFALMSKKDATAERLKNGEKGVSYGGPGGSGGSLMDNRGPDKLNATKLPGIVRDPGFATPKTAAAYGVNLDGNDGAGQPPAGICKHSNYVSVDGRLKGVDNQLYTVLGCVAGHQGKNGYRNQTSNAHRADGTITTLLEISGIDNAKNDDSVEVAVFYSLDQVGRDASGKQFFADYSFRLTDNPQFAYYNRRLHGRIVDGIITTDPVKQFEMNMGLDPLLRLFSSQMRLEILPDGNLKGVLAGYQEWELLMDRSAGSYSEQLFGYQAPGLYQAFKRSADGLKDPVTGECNGISAAYEIDAVPAFISAARPKAAQAGAASKSSSK